VNPRKVYAVDTGLLAAMSFHLTEDRGALLENLVYLHLRRQGLAPEYYVSDSGLEVDFILPENAGRRRLLIQVCWSLKAPETRKREQAALRDAMKELGLRRGLILTWLEEEPPQPDIEVMPVWKWLVTTAAGARAE